MLAGVRLAPFMSLKSAPRVSFRVASDSATRGRCNPAGLFLPPLRMPLQMDPSLLIAQEAAPEPEGASVGTDVAADAEDEVEDAALRLEGEEKEA